MNRRVGSIPLVIIGVIALIIGAVFASQGADLIRGSAMSGESLWVYIGVIIAVIGLVLLVLGLRRPKSDGSDS